MNPNRIVKRAIEIGKLKKKRRARPRKTWWERMEDTGIKRGKTMRYMSLSSLRKNCQKLVKESRKT